MNDPITVSQDRRCWALGAADAFRGLPARQEIADPLAYAAGRVEGEAWRNQGRDLADELRRARLPYLVD